MRQYEQERLSVSGDQSSVDADDSEVIENLVGFLSAV